MYMLKHTFTLLLLFMLPLSGAVAQNCCKKPSGMKMIACLPGFKDAHPIPEPFAYTGEAGKMITFPTFKGKDGNAFYIPSPTPTDKVLLIFHEWWGLNDYIKQVAADWQTDLGNVDVYAVDLFDGSIARTPDAASKLMTNLNEERGVKIINGLLAKIGRHKRIATLGWCMGGSWSFTGTVIAGTQSSACVMYYGFPPAEYKKIRPLKAPVLYIYGAQDNYITREMVNKFGADVGKA
ncbi:MAG: dienelactone hydrolase family protein, partial [Chitinophagia bacterium]|nr:dienelactone hydrolase family protein [Chitinophagia bacterium]